MAPYVDVVALAADNGRIDRAEAIDRLDGGELLVRASCVVNASGPWVDRVRHLEDSRAQAIARLSEASTSPPSRRA